MEGISALVFRSTEDLTRDVGRTNRITNSGPERLGEPDQPEGRTHPGRPRHDDKLDDERGQVVVSD